MIHIVADLKEFSISIKGHANYDKKGKDIVCAAVSTLAYTLRGVIENNPKYYDRPLIEMEENGTIIKCTPKQKHINEARIIFESVLFGFDLIAENYPEFVKIKKL